MRILAAVIFTAVVTSPAAAQEAGDVIVLTAGVEDDARTLKRVTPEELPWRKKSDAPLTFFVRAAIGGKELEIRVGAEKTGDCLFDVRTSGVDETGQEVGSSTKTFNFRNMKEIEDLDFSADRDRPRMVPIVGPGLCKDQDGKPCDIDGLMHANHGGMLSQQRIMAAFTAIKQICN